jgi:hypothetical protein
VVEIGRDGPEGKRWARRGSGEFLALVDTAALAVLERDPAELRDARVFDAEPKDVRAVIVKGGSTEFSAQRADADADWNLKDAAGAVRAPAPRAVDDLIDRMKWLRATSFDQPKVELHELRTLVFQGEQGDLGRIDFFEPRGAAAADGEKLLYAKSTWRPGLTLGVRAEAVGTLPAKADDLVEPAADAAAPPSAP